MPILENARHERFAQEIAKGATASEAYIRAGYKESRAAASRLSANVNIQSRISEIVANAAKRAEITIADVLSELAKVGFANMRDYMGANDSGDPYLDFSKLTREQAAALGEVTVEDFTEGRGENKRDVRRVKFKLWDKISALEKIGRHLGMFKDEMTVNHTYVARIPEPAETAEEWQKQHAPTVQ